MQGIYRNLKIVRHGIRCVNGLSVRVMTEAVGQMCFQADLFQCGGYIGRFNDHDMEACQSSFRPWHRPFQLGQELLPTGLPLLVVKGEGGEGSLFHAVTGC